MQEGKVVVSGGFTIGEGRRETKGKGDRERYTQLNEEFQRIAIRDNKDLLKKKKRKESFLK